MKLSVGSEAPHFDVEDSFGKTWSVPREMGGKYFTIVFLRHLGCPLCMRRIDELSNDIGKFKDMGAEVIVVVEGTPTRVKTYAAKKKIRVPIVGDRDKNLYRGFGVEPGNIIGFIAPSVLKATIKATLQGYMHGKFEGDELQVPADFIIAPDGKIAWAHYGKDISDSSPNAELLKRLQAVIKK